MFFYQAEDGIRDYKVTGVQTCALPISPDGLPYLVMEYVDGTPIDDYCRARSLSIPEKLRLFLRSEERRVGRVETTEVGGVVKREKRLQEQLIRRGTYITTCCDIVV